MRKLGLTIFFVISLLGCGKLPSGLGNLGKPLDSTPAKLTLDQKRKWQTVVQGIGRMDLSIDRFDKVDPRPTDGVLDYLKGGIRNLCEAPQTYPSLPGPDSLQTFQVSNTGDCPVDYLIRIQRGQTDFSIEASFEIKNKEFVTQYSFDLMTLKTSSVRLENSADSRFLSYRAAAKLSRLNSAPVEVQSFVTLNRVGPESNPSILSVQRFVEFKFANLVVNLEYTRKNSDETCSLNQEILPVRECHIYFSQLGSLVTGFVMDAG